MEDIIPQTEGGSSTASPRVLDYELPSLSYDDHVYDYDLHQDIKGMLRCELSGTWVFDLVIVTMPYIRVVGAQVHTQVGVHTPVYICLESIFPTDRTLPGNISTIRMLNFMGIDPTMLIIPGQIPDRVRPRYTLG